MKKIFILILLICAIGCAGANKQTSLSISDVYCIKGTLGVTIILQGKDMKQVPLFKYNPGTRCFVEINNIQYVSLDTVNPNMYKDYGVKYIEIKENKVLRRE